MSDNVDRLRASLADRYRIERELGAGGMATVFLAHDIKHDRKVAIKVLKPELAAVLGGDRFVVEIRTTASLQHPHILPLFDSGTADGFLFYVMPYIKGETIREKLNRETQFGVDDAVRIAREVADALDYAHRHGVIHRDIKPENLLLYDGRAMVMDFGIALAVSAAAGGRMTETGLSLGTPHYMSPEQATADKEITGRSDVYSLASVLYEMLAGEPPHTAGSAQAVIMKIIADTPRPVLELRRNAPPNVSAALSRALEKLSADRFESAKAFADALANPSFTTAVGATAVMHAPVRQYSRIGAALIAAALVLTAIAGVMVGRQSVRSVEPPLAQFVIELPDSITNLNWCCGTSQVLTSDGSTIVFVGIRRGSGRLYRRAISGLDAEPIDGTEGASSPALSPDGKWVSFETLGQLKKVLVTGGLAVPIANVGTISGATWVSNDTILFSNNSNSTLWLIGASGGGKPAPVAGLDSSGTYRHPSMLPGGRHALVQWRSKSTIGEPRIISVDLRTGDVDTVAVGVVARYALGSIVIGAADGRLLVQSFDVNTRRTVGQAIPLPLQASLSGGLLPEFSVSANGWLAYEIARTAPGTDVLRILDRTRDSALVLDESGPMMGEFEDLTISPDGNRILVRVGTTRGEIWILNPKDGTRSRITVGGGSTPVWSPDGKRMAYYFRGDSSSKPGIYIRPIDQDSTPQLVLAGPNFVPNSITPDGASIAFSLGALNLGSLNPYGSQVAASDIGIVTIGDTTVRWILRTEFNERQPQISKDGKRLAYTSDRSGRYEVYVQEMAGEAVPVPISANGGTSPRWARDGRLYYIDLVGQVHTVSIPAGPGAAVTSRDIVSRRANSADLNYANVNWDLFPDKRMLIIDRHGLQKLRIALVQNWPSLVRDLGAK